MERVGTFLLKAAVAAVIACAAALIIVCCVCLSVAVVHNTYQKVHPCSPLP